MPTGLGRSPVDVQRCPLGSRVPRLRVSGAHWDRELARRRGGEEEKEKEKAAEEGAESYLKI